MSVVPVETRYICPGETHSISRSVHLSRLAAFYPNCRDCPLKSDDGELPRQTIQRVERDERSVERKSLFTPEGVRGIHRNELTRESAGRLAGALAGRVWERMISNRQSEDGSRRIPRSQPLIVVGLDNRDSSPDLLAGVTSSLLRMDVASSMCVASRHPLFASPSITCTHPPAFTSQAVDAILPGTASTSSLATVNRCRRRSVWKTSNDVSKYRRHVPPDTLAHSARSTQRSPTKRLSGNISTRCDR